MVSVPVLAADDRAASVEPSGMLANTFRGGFKDLLTATRNQEFLQTSLTGDRVEGLKTHLGRDVANRISGLQSAEGKTIRDFLEKNPAVATEYPQVVTYLVSAQRQSGVKLYANDQATQPLTLTNPGRVIPSTDLSSFGSGGDERFRDYLKSNFGLEENQVAAYGAFLNLASGAGGTGVLPSRDGGGGGSFSSILGKFDGSKGTSGLYLPSRELLATMSQVMSFYSEFLKDPGADPATFKGPDGRSLGDLMAEFEPDASKRPSLDDLRRMSPEDVKSRILGLLEGMAKRDIEGPNRMLFDMGLAVVSPQIDQSASRSGRGNKRHKMEGVLGNGHIREMNEALYKSLILDELKPSERDRIELESEGEFFAIRGRPGDIHQKHYDPPVDPQGLLFGAGMNLDNHPVQNEQK